ncbi:MAG: hypothetical protein AB1467_06050 [Candidatus Diapherotrites archaeon]
MKKKIEKKEKSNNYYRVGFFALLIIVAGLIIGITTQNYFIPKSAGNQAKEKEDKNKYSVDLNINNIAGQFQPVIDKLLLHEEMKNYNGKQATIQELTEKDLNMLKTKYPVIYGDAKAGQYLFLYSDLLVIYDFEKDKIVKSFVVQDINIG